MDSASSPAKMDAEPVCSSTYMDSANFSVSLPIRELICPKIKRVKLRVKSLGFIGCTSVFHFDGTNLHSQDWVGCSLSIFNTFRMYVYSQNKIAFRQLYFSSGIFSKNSSTRA